ncbi:hypothetical protein GCM10011505_35340 [Tistrella bauzanensis]|uniref:DUF3574 domain-containing protein n=1 Tax=Tistrella bauzanensis TaxID=657419 RepID=A0ABQ1IU26_9PROT|nr:DUF3574 domain-containing protein [Tistrella bauzanensis]GGB51196.1 hypothetical protein GCM10011505_35340 [Tistrella bauzanensis]
MRHKPAMRHRPVMAAIGLALLLGACAGGPPRPGASQAVGLPHGASPACLDSDARMIRAQLFFGLSRPDGRPPVTAADFDGFVDQTVSPAFPDGFTIIETTGGWRDTETGQTIREAGRSLILLADGPAPALRQRLDTLRRDYMTRFDQQAVGLALDTACVSF